jgi:hypothetical protein
LKGIKRKEPSIPALEGNLKLRNVLKTLPDTRDNRGKRHSLVFLIVTVVFSILLGRSTVSKPQPIG